MIRLNLPSFPIKLSGTAEKPAVWDILRRRYIALTPEEWVRQHFVHYLIEQLGYPSALLANEVSLQMSNGKKLRADTVLYDTELQPRMIIEYKAPDIPLTQKVLEQASAYNLLLHVDYLVISNGMQSYCCKMDYEHQKILYLEGIPLYQNI